MRSLLVTHLFFAYCGYISAGVVFRDGRQFFGGIASNGRPCAEIGLNVLKGFNGIKGNAVDAAIAVLLCEGVTGPQSMGIGGGFLATVYIKSKNIITTINAREAAPASASKDMFVGVDKITGGVASAIPSEIKGYWELKQKYGNPKYPWEKLFEETIKLCKDGYEVDKFLAKVLEDYKDRILNEPTLKEIFVNPKTKTIYKEYDVAYRPVLAKTLEKIAKNGAKEFYDGPTGKLFIDDVKKLNGKLTLDDLKNYKVIEKEPVAGLLGKNLTLYTVPLPGSGLVLNTILQLLRGRVEGVDNATLIHRITEAMKHGYGLRSKLADIDAEPSIRDVLIQAADYSYQKKLHFNISQDDAKTHNDPEYYGGVFGHNDHGTSNIAVIDDDGNAITATSTVNNVFGAFVRSPQTGIILNDEMDDFSTPNKVNAYGFAPSEINFIKPGKRPMSSMSPSIVLDNAGNVRLAIGAAGGSQITTSIALTMVRCLYLGMTLYKAINAPRFHHQLVPMKFMYEDRRFETDVLRNLYSRGHTISPEFLVNIPGFSAVTGIFVDDDFTYPVFDNRRGGSAIITPGRKYIL